MRAILALLLSLLLEPAWAQVPMTGAGKGTPAAAYQGPGDIVSGAIIWGSCARVYSNALASTSTSLCDLVDTSTGTTAICTLRGSSSGFVDLAGAYCTGSATPSAACAAATGGACRVSKVYDQIGGTSGWTQATNGLRPVLTFSALNGLPSLTCNGSGTCAMASDNLSASQPYTFSVVYTRTGAPTTLQSLLTTGGAAVRLGPAASADTVSMSAGSAFSASATDSAFHAVQSVFNNASSALVVDGSATTGTAGTGNISTTPVNLMTSNGASTVLTGKTMEAGIWPSGFNATQYGNMNSNQHGVSGYNF